MKFGIGSRRFARAWLLLALAATYPIISEPAFAQGNEAGLEAETTALWQRVRGIMGSGNFSEAARLLAAQQTKLNQQLGASHKLSATNQQLLDLARQGEAALGPPPASAPPAPPAPAAAPAATDKQNVYVKPEDMERAQAALARAKEARGLITGGRELEALPKLDEAVGVMEETLGPDQDLVKVNRDLLLLMYKKHGRSEQLAAAEARAARARASYKPAGETSPEVQATLQVLTRAMTAFTAHDFDTALKLFEEAGPTVQKHITSVDARVNFLSIHASLCDYATQYDRAEGLHKQAIAEMERAKGPDSADMAALVESLVTHYMRRMEPQKALPHASRVVALQRRHQPGTVALIDALRNLGDLKVVTGDRSGLNELNEAGTLLGQLVPPDRARQLELAASLAQAAELSGNREMALKLKAAACDAASGVTDPTVVSNARAACIEAAWSQGNLAKAEQLLQESLAETARTYNNPRSVMWEPISQKLALVRYALGKREQALQLATELEEHSEKRLARELSTGSDAQKRAMFEAYHSGMNDVLSMGGDGSAGPVGVRLALTTLLRRKGRALDASADAVRAQRLLTTPEQRALLARQAELRGLMVGLVLRGNKELDPAATAAAISKLEAEEESVTKQLAQSSEQYRALTAPVTIEAVQRQLPPDTALVEYVAFIRRDKNLFRPADKRYYAYVLRSSGEPVAVDLGDALPIGRSAEQLRASIRERRDPSGPARSLEQLVIQPLRAHLSGIKRLVVSPDDDLNLVPFAALKDGAGEYLLEQYEVDYLTSGRDLLRLSAIGPARSSPVFVGNPNFDAGGSAAAAPSGASDRAGDLARARFSPLPGTDQEVAAIGKLLSGSRSFTGPSATKAVLQGLEAPLVLHVATHGFFLDTPSGGGSGERGLELDLGGGPPPPPPRDENPLIRSGLALSGANDKTSVSGILTALEASSIHLDGTRLVVLSACETGIGKVEMGDGVYGLRRALVVAGSQTQVMSLWKVDDNATRDLMIGFYERLRQGHGRGASLREEQLKMLRSKAYAHPYYWAAFIPSGSWDKMDFDVVPTGSTAPSPGASSSNSSGSYSGPRDVITSDGVRTALMLRRMSLSNLLDQPDRTAWTLGLAIETQLLSGQKEGETGLAFHDAALAEIELGLRTSEAAKYPTSEESGAFAYGYYVGYQAALGYRGHPLGVLFGVRPGLRGVTLGDARTGGVLFPLFGVLELQTGDEDLLAVSGWYGAILGDHPSLGVRADLSLESAFFRFQVDQNKLPTTLGRTSGDDRVEVGRQVNTAYTFAIGAHL